MSVIEGLQTALDTAQDELAQAEMSLVEASARAEAARLEARKLKAAVAALSGEPPPAAEFTHDIDSGAAYSGPTTGEWSDERAEQAELSQEEFDKERKRRQRRRKLEEQANNPYGQVKCSGCGKVGQMSPQIHTTSTGAPVKLLCCGQCGNQLPM
jgi:hypothetical protein